MTPTSISLMPVWAIDIIGSTLMIIGSVMCLRTAYAIQARDRESPLAIYLVWFCGAIFAFAVSRSLGHIVKHLLFFTGHREVWKNLAPISGSINSITFVVIAAVTLFFQRMQALINRMARDRDKIERASRELLDLNRALGSTVFERTRAEMALRVAHDIRNPAAIIGGLVKRMTQEIGQQGGPESDRLARVKEQAERLEEMVARLETIRTEAPGAFVPLDVNGLVEDCAALLQPEATEKGASFVLKLSPALLLFQGNEQLMKIAIMHLVRNSIEACRPGDTIVIATELSEKGVVLRVDDSGPGIPAEILAHIFTPFLETKDGGTGLGLPYVRQIVEEHNGTLALKSAVGTGTSAEVVLPTHLGVLRQRELG